MSRIERFVKYAAVVSCFAVFSTAQQAAEQPETVMITFRAKSGAETELAHVIARHWTTARELKLVREAPHVTIRGSEGERAYFIDIFTWRDARTPDAAPAEILKIWGEMNRLVEARGGHAGLEIAPVSVVAP
ncbi:MAG TPA: hypothetical protein VJN43_05285 [Bryobacteraceae bacterium]|nr:hypothetical protein [Bryobacteraceae bacterium]